MVLLNAFNSISILELSLKSMGLSKGSIERFAVNCDKIHISTNEVFLIIAMMSDAMDGLSSVVNDYFNLNP